VTHGSSGSQAEAQCATLAPAAGRLIAAAAVTALVATAAIRPDFSGIDWLGLGLLVAIAAASERFGISLYGDSSISIAFVFLLAAAMQYGAEGVLVVAPLMALAGHSFGSLPLNKLVYNVSVTTLGGLAAAGVFHVVTGTLADAPQAAVLLPALLAAGANYVVTAGLVAWIISLSAGDRLLQVWSEKYLWLLPHYVVLGVFGFIVAFGYQELGVPGLLVMTTPPLLIRYGIKQYVGRTTQTIAVLKATNSELREANTRIAAISWKIEEGYQETLRALVSALDVRDTEVHGHSLRVAELSMQLAARMGIAPESETWRNLQHGALLHDVGKIGVPDNILRKQSALTPEEWEVMREHPEKGYAMLRQVHFLRGAAELAYCHHERYDGAGYPRGLRGDQIPLTARIFALTDAFDAMTARRPYREPFTVGQAYEEIRRCSGTQFDPRAVEAFLDLFAVPSPNALQRAA
jgi:putative nucleotidyltransferase with HDIG domain